MKFLLDTSTVSYYLRGTAPVVERVHQHKPSQLGISAVTAMELAYGAARRQSAKLTAAIDALLSDLQVLSFDASAARLAGEVRAALERKGIALQLADSQIAGHALALDVTLVSSDAAFKRIAGLTVKDWTKG